MFFFSNYQKKKKGNSSIYLKKLKRKSILNLCIFFCKKKISLDSKILNFFLNVSFLFLDHKINSVKIVQKSIIVRNYQIFFIFLKSFLFMVNLLNSNFNMNSENFFSKNKEILSFFYFYKYYLMVLFLYEKENLLDLHKFILVLYYRYFLFSLYFYLNLFVLIIKEQKLKKKAKKFVIDSILSPNIPLPFKKSYSFYNNLVFNPTNKVRVITAKNRYGGKNLFYTFCNKAGNNKILDDDKFFKLLSLLRQFLRLRGERSKEVLLIFNKILETAIPLTKVIYQRRGRIFIPLTVYIYQPKIRESLGIKSIYKYGYSIKGLANNLIENKLIISLLDIDLIKDKYLFQPEISAEDRKLAFNKGYFLKTTKVSCKYM